MSNNISPYVSTAVGLRFIPTDEELIGYFLLRKIVGIFIPETFVLKCDLYGKENPWELWERYSNQIHFNPCDGSKDLYFFTKLKRKKPNAMRVERRVGIGAWQGEDGKNSIMSSTASHICIGFKKRLRFEKSRTHHDGEWIMHEYSLNASLLPPNFSQSIVNELVLCRIRKNEHQSTGQSNKGGCKRKTSSKHDEAQQSPCKLKKSRQQEEDLLSLTEPNKMEAVGLHEKEHLCSTGVARKIIGYEQEETKQPEPSTNSEIEKSNKLDEDSLLYATDLEKELLEFSENLENRNNSETKKTNNDELSDNTVFTMKELFSSEQSTDKLDEENLLFAMDLEKELFEFSGKSEKKNNSKTKRIDEKELSNDTVYNMDEWFPSEQSTKKSDKLDEESLLFTTDLEKKLVESFANSEKKNDGNESYILEEENFHEIPLDETYLNGPLNKFSRIFNEF